MGTITAGGVYSAPPTVPSPNTLQIEPRPAWRTLRPASTALQRSEQSLAGGHGCGAADFSIPVGNFTIGGYGTEIYQRGRGFIRRDIPAHAVCPRPPELTATGTATTAQAGTVQITVINPDPGSATSNQFALEVGTPANELSAVAAARLLEQSTWGVNPQSLSHLQAVGVQAFLNEQFAAPVSTYPAPASTDDITVVQKRFFTNAFTGQDQLRQRVAFALSEIMVASATKVNNPSAFVLWQNMFQNDAFGNFSTLLTDVTLSPVMGNYLDMVNNDKLNPATDSRRQRKLRPRSPPAIHRGPEGAESGRHTVQLDGSGNPIPTYTQDTITAFARVFTGWTYPTKPGATARFGNPEFYGGPMIAIDSHHDTDAKTLLNGVTLPAGGTAQSDLTAALQETYRQSSERRPVYLLATHTAPGDQQSQP